MKAERATVNEESKYVMKANIMTNSDANNSVVAIYKSLEKSKTTFMRHNNLLITLLAASAIAVGCDKEQTTSQQFDKVQAKTQQAAQDMKDYTYAQKAAFVETMQAQLTALNKDLDQLSAKVEKSSDAAKAEAKPKLQALRDQADKLNQELDKAKNATESTWDDVKAGTKKAYNELKDDLQQARQWISDKIAS